MLVASGHSETRASGRRESSTRCLLSGAKDAWSGDTIWLFKEQKLSFQLSAFFAQGGKACRSRPDRHLVSLVRVCNQERPQI